MTYASIAPALGLQNPTDIFVPDTTQRWPLGQRMHFVDAAYWGGGDFIYGKAAQASGVGRLVFPALDWAMTDIPNTAGTGLPIYVTKANMPINTFGWFQTSGLAPWLATASVAAGTVFGITAAGSVGAVSSGKQVLGARVLGASTFTLTKSAYTQNGSGVIKVNNADGLFHNGLVSGTGIPGATRITAIDTSGNQITVGNLSTATGTITMTLTYTTYLLVTFNNPFVQGQIT
jgi:hypothetical protein